MPEPDRAEGDRRFGPHDADPRVGRFQRVLFAALGLIAGDAALLLLLLYNALRLRAASLKAHMGEPHLAVSQASEMFLIYATFSVLGWALVGIPIALLFPTRLTRLAWPVRIVIGAAMGPFALFLIFIVLFALQGRLGAFSLAHTGGLWPLSVVVSTVSFVVYAGLLRRWATRRHH